VILIMHETFSWVRPLLDFCEIVWNNTNVSGDHGSGGIDIRLKCAFGDCPLSLVK